MRAAFGIGTRQAVANIIAVFQSADHSAHVAGTRWYRVARDHAASMATHHNVSLETAAAVIAHTSAGTSWSVNLRAANDVLGYGDTPEPIYRANVIRALTAVVSDTPIATLKGLKTRNFALNILGNENAVTIDRWALRVATGEYDQNALKRVGAYDAMARCYRIAAKRCGVSPSTMQAITWVAIRGNAE